MSSGERSTSEFDRQLVEYLLSTDPASLAIIGRPSPEGPGVGDDMQEMPRVSRFETLADCHAPSGAVADASSAGASVALLYLDDDERLQPEGALATELGTAVRHFPERLVVSSHSPEPADTAFFAFGFRKLQLAGQGSIRLFEYCLSDYKQPPDWLNARYWANPDRFGNDEDSDIYSEDDGDEEE